MPSRQRQQIEIGNLSRSVDSFHNKDGLITQRNIVRPELMIGLIGKCAESGNQVAGREVSGKKRTRRKETGYNEGEFLSM